VPRRFDFEVVGKAEFAEVLSEVVDALGVMTGGPIGDQSRTSPLGVVRHEAERCLQGRAERIPKVDD
jgi:hypothetical protein